MISKKFKARTFKKKGKLERKEEDDNQSSVFL